MPRLLIHLVAGSIASLTPLTELLPSALAANGPNAVHADAAAPSAQVTLWDGVQPVDAARLGRGAASEEPGRAPGGPAEGIPVVDVSIEDAPDGDMPREVRWRPDGSAYVVVNRDTDNLTIHDPATGLATAVVPVGLAPVDVAVTPDGARAVTANLLGDSVTVVDLAAQTVETTIPVSGAQPFRVLVTDDGAYAVVAVINTGPDSVFSIIDLASLSEVATVPAGGMGAIGFSFAVETGEVKNLFTDFTLAGDVAAMYDRAGDLVRLVDVPTASLLAEIPVPEGPDSIAASPNGDTVVVGCETADEIAVIDVAGPSLASSFVVPDLGDRLVRVTPDGQEVVCWSGNLLSFHDLSTGIVQGFVDHGNFVIGDLAFTSDGSTLLVGSARLRVIDVASRSLLTTLVLPPTYEIATEPGGDRVVGLDNVFGQELQRAVIDGAASQYLGEVPAGVPAEGDNAFSVAWTPDGGTLLVANVWSGNVTVIDRATGTATDWLDVGLRTREVRMSPDGTTAIATAADEALAAVIDVASAQVTDVLFPGTRPGPVRFAPDSSAAYILNIAGTDRVSFVDLTGPSPQITAQLPVGQAGAASGPTFTEWSGMELSPDGATLVVCDSFNDQLRVFDTATRAEVATVPTGDFPLRVAFGPNSDRAYVVNHFGDDLTIVDIAGAASQAIGTVSGLARFPLVVVADEDDRHVYVGTRALGSDGVDGLQVVDTLTQGVVATLETLDGYPRDAVLEPGGELLLALTGGGVGVVVPDGPSSILLGAVELPGSPRQIAFDPVTRSVAAAMPSLDAVTIVDLPGGEDPPAPCPADVDGSGAVGFDDLLTVLGAFGDAGGPADVDDSGLVDFDDLLTLLGAWGPCPG